jgi:hypothetical protein
MEKRLKGITAMRQKGRKSGFQSTPLAFTPLRLCAFMPLRLSL